MGGKPRPNHHLCHYDLCLSDEEDAALHWLSETLGNMMKDCSVEHSRRSLMAHTAVQKVLEKAHYLHDLAHVHEAELDQMETMVMGMAGFPRQVGIVGDEKLN